MPSPRRALLSLCATALLAAGSSSASSNATSVALDGWYPCELASSSTRDAQCAIFQAPLCYDGVCATPSTSTRTIDVFVKRFLAKTDGKPNVIMIQVGTGSATLNVEAAMRSIHSTLKGGVNLYTIDRRGMGRSTKLDCVAAQAQSSTSPGGTSISVDEVASCADELQSRYGKDLSAFSVTSAAKDIQYFINNFLPGQQTFVYGAGFGSSIVERLIHLKTSEVAGYVLDGAITTSGLTPDKFEYISKWDEDFDRVAQQFMKECDASPSNCGNHFAGSLSSVLRSLEEELSTPTSDCAIALDAQLAKVFDYNPGDYPPAQSFRWAMGELMLRQVYRKFVPVVIYRLARCTGDDAKVLSHFFDMLSTTIHSTSNQDPSRNSLLYKLVAFSESWETPTPSNETMQARFYNASMTTGTYSTQSYCAFSKEDSEACKPFADFTNYSASPIVYSKDKYWNVAAQPPSNVSVLMLSGKLDPIAPHLYAQNSFEVLNTTNKQLIVFDYATHGALWSTPTPSNVTCGVQILATYVSQGGNLSKVDTSCISTVPKLNFTIESRLVTSWLSTSSPYDGKFQTSASTGGINKALSSPYRLAIIGLGVLLALALVTACVFVAKWRRARKERQTFCADESAYNSCVN